MCGRYFIRLTPEKLKELFGTENLLSFDVNSNACPTQFLPIIVRSGKELSRAGMGRWGLLPSHASHDDMALSAKLKNARSETIRQKVSFSELWMKGRRCIVPASGFFEWPEVKVKGHPGYSVTHAEDMSFAGIWNKHLDIVTFTILTCAASQELSDVHSRMPVMFAANRARDWLDASNDDAYRMMETANLKTGFRKELAEKPISRNEQPVLV